MFEDGYLSPSGVRIYSALSHTVSGLDPTDSDDPQVQDLLRKYGERGRELFSEHSEDALTWSFFHAVTKLPTRVWLIDLLRVAINDRFAKQYAPYVDSAEIRFWTKHPAPKTYLRWLGEKVMKEGEASFKHLDRFGDRVRAKHRLAKIMNGDPTLYYEMPTEVDVELRLGKELLIFIEVKLNSDAREHGTFSPSRNQIVRNIEIAAETAKESGFKDWRFILLTLDRLPNKIYTKVMRRYRHSDMRLLRQWDEPGNWKAIKKDLPHRDKEGDDYFRTLTKKLGWLLWTDCWKLLAHYAVNGRRSSKS